MIPGIQYSNPTENPLRGICLRRLETKSILVSTYNTLSAISCRQMVVHMEKKSPFDPLHKWTDHEACWQMQFRGSLGETLLHVLIMCNTKAHTRVAKILLRCFPKLAIDVVEGEEYLGQW